VWVVCVLALRFFAQPGGLVPAIDAPPPTVEDRLAVAGDDCNDRADDPSDVDDDDADSDDAALPAGIVAVIAPPAVAPPSWSILTLADKNAADPLFRPPRHA
jgi:hypothetical protein